MDENLNAARVLISLLLLTLVINASLLLAQYAPPRGFDAPTLGFDIAPASEEWGELLPNVEDIVGDRPSALLSSPDSEGRSSSTVKGESRTPAERASGTLEADVTGGNQSDGSETTAPDLQPGSASTAWSLGLPSTLGGFAPDGLLEPDYSMTGAPGIVGGEGPQAGEGPQGSGGPPASENPQGGGGLYGGGGQPASESPHDGGGQPASEGPQGGAGPHGGGGLHGNGGSSHDDVGSSHGGGGPPQGGGGPPHGGGGPPQGGGGPPHGDGGPPQGGGGPPHGDGGPPQGGGGK
jgi:hypothetical protein